MSLQDSLFAEDVEYDVTLFSRDKRRKRVLVFPPVNNYRRFVIHQLVQDRFADLLHTFSIGQAAARRTVVCYKTDVIRDPKLNGAEPRPSGANRSTDSLRAMGVEGRRSPSASPERARVQRQVKSVPKVEIYRPPAARRVKTDAPINTEQIQVQSPNDSTSAAKSSRQRRPDRAVYVPRHRRSLEPEGSPQPVETSRVNRATRDSSTPNSVSNVTPKASRRKQQDPACCTLQTAECTKKETDVCDSKGDAASTNKSPGRLPRERGECPRTDLKDATGVETSTVETCSQNSSTEPAKPVDSETEKVPKESENSAAPDVVCERTDDAFRSQIVEEDEVSNNAPSENNISLGPIEAYIHSEINAADKEVDRSDKCKDNNITSTAKSKKSDKKSLNPDEITNQKNTQMVRRNVISEVLIISDNVRKEPKTVKEVSTVPTTPPEKKVKKIERLKSKPAAPPSPPIKINRDECDWDSLFDDNGDCLDPTLIEELTSAVGEVVIEQPKNDYKVYTRHVEVSSDEFAHVVEIYNFPSEFKTSDLAAAFSPFKNGGFELKWVDDTHCLGVFSSPLIAAEVLASDHPLVKTRPLSEATALSKTKAKRSAEFLQPYRSRPETCAALARRLVTGALGVRLATARQEREHEKNVLREAKEKRRLANKQREDAWEGIIPEK